MLEKGGLDLFLQWVVKDSTGVLLSLFAEGPETGQTVDACLFFWLLLTVYLIQGHNVVAFNSSASDSTPCQPAKTVIYRTTNSEEEIPGGEIWQRDSASLTTFTPRLKQAWGLHTHSGTKLFRAEPHWGAKVFSPVASASSSSTMTWTMENLYIHVSAFHLIIYASWLALNGFTCMISAKPLVFWATSRRDSVCFGQRAAQNESCAQCRLQPSAANMFPQRPSSDTLTCSFVDSAYCHK